MKNTVLIPVILLLTAAAGTLQARDYDLNGRDSIDLSGVDEVVFDLRGPNCSLCVRTADLESELSGGGGRELDLKLTGRISSNREKAVPSLISGRAGRTLTIRLYPEGTTFFGLSQSGQARFEAVLPASFSGRVSAVGSSGDITVRDLNTGEVEVRSSSGDLVLSDITAADLSARLSSGRLDGRGLTSRGELELDSSSGSLDLEGLNAGSITIRASSGDITITDARSAGDVNIRASSGRIEIGSLSGGIVDLESSSGRIGIGTLESEEAEIGASSGDVVLGTVRTGSLDLDLSSGDLEITGLEALETSIRTSGDTLIGSARGALELNGSSGRVDLSMAAVDAPVLLDVSSGDITLTIPAAARFDVNLEANSGRIRSAFAILGNLDTDRDEIAGSVNGGGPLITVSASSGDITLNTR